MTTKRKLALLGIVTAIMLVAWGSLPQLGPPPAQAASAIIYSMDGGNGTPYLPTCGSSMNGVVAYYAGWYFRCQYGPYLGYPSSWHWHLL